MREIDEYEASVARELLRKGSDKDEEKRAMLFALQTIRNFPTRLIEAGSLAQRAHQEAEAKKRLAQLENAGQAYETLGPEVLGDPNF